MPNTIGTVYVQVEPTTDGIGGKLEQALGAEASSAGTSAGSKFASALGKAAKVGAAAIGVATTTVTAFGKSSVEAGMAFDSSMSQVGATMGYSVQEINTAGSEAQQTMQQLRDFAQQMGSTTAFSASEAADALNYMALAGYDADTSMQMLPTVLNLAASGGIDLASASDMVTDASSALGLSLEDTYIMVDEMAAASSNSNTSVAQLGDAFLTIGANAKSLSGGTTELATALGLLADNGIKGSEGGTKLRNILLALNPSTDKAVAAWDALGVSAYDADGNLRPLEDTFADLNTAMAGMTDQEKKSTLSAMFNKADLAAVNALLDTSADRWKELGEEIYYSDGAASAMAEVQLDNLEGDMTLFKSALEGAQIAVSDQLTPSLRSFVQFGSEGLSTLTSAFTEGGLSGAMEAFGTILSDGLAMIIEMLPSMVNAGMQLLNALGTGLLQNLPMITDAALQIITMIATELIANLPSIIEAGLQILVQLAMGIAQALPTLIPTIVEVVLTIVQYLIENIDLLIDASIALITGLAEGLINALPVLIAKVPQLIVSLVTAIIQQIPKIIKAGYDLFVKINQGIENAKSLIVAKVRSLVESLKAAIIEKVQAFIQVGKDIINGIKQGLADAWESLTTWFSTKISSLADKAKELLKIGSPSKVFANEVGKWIPAGIAQGIESNLGMLDNAMNGMNDYILGNAYNAEATISASTVSSGAYNSGLSSRGESSVLDLLSTYLPVIARGDNINVTLEGDAKALFKSVKATNNVYTRTTGRSAFA